MPDTRRLPPLKSLAVLEALHQTGSVTGAAGLLNVSHSAVSHQIRVLENWARVPLFVRRGRTTLLTEAGRSLAEVSHGAFDAIRHEIDRLPMRGSRAVSVAALPVVANALILPRLAGFGAAEPGIALHLAFAHTDRPTTPAPDIQVLFLRRAAFLAGDREVARGEALPVCKPALLARQGGNAQRLITQGPLIHDEDLRMWPAWFAAAGLDRPAQGWDATMIIEGSALLHAAALAGAGVAFARAAFVQDDLAAGRLVALSDVAIDADWAYVMRLDAMRGSDADVVRVADWLLAPRTRAPASSP